MKRATQAYKGYTIYRSLTNGEWYVELCGKVLECGWSVKDCQRIVDDAVALQAVYPPDESRVSG